MKLDKTAITTKIHLVLDTLSRYSVFLFILTFLGIYGFLVVRISSLIQANPPTTTSPADPAQTTIKRLTIDENSIKKIQELEDQNVEVKSLFQSARSNPFTE